MEGEEGEGWEGREQGDTPYLDLADLLLFFKGELKPGSRKTLFFKSDNRYGGFYVSQSQKERASKHKFALRKRKMPRGT